MSKFLLWILHINMVWTNESGFVQCHWVDRKVVFFKGIFHVRMIFSSSRKCFSPHFQIVAIHMNCHHLSTTREDTDICQQLCCPPCHSFTVNLRRTKGRHWFIASISLPKIKWNEYLITPTLPSLKESWRTFNLASCLSAFETDIKRSDIIFILCTKEEKEIDCQINPPIKHLLHVKYKESKGQAKFLKKQIG